jgi:predicted porin
VGPIRFCAWGAAATLIGLASVIPAKATDSGVCCGDLEQRVAELEATAARKGNRKVSLEIYGQVNRALYGWGDGGHSGVDTNYPHSGLYFVDNNITSTRLGVKGEGPIAPGWKSGFNIEFEFVDSSSNQVSQTSTFSKTTGQILGGDEGAGETGPIRTRQAYWRLDSEQFGRVSMGHQNEATKDITLINLSGGAVASDARGLWNRSFIIQGPLTAATRPFLISANYAGLRGGGLRWGAISSGLDSERADAVRYDSPSIYGFVLSASYGETVMWDVALRCVEEWGGFRFAAGAGYWVQDDAYDIYSGAGQSGYSNGANARRNEFKGSASVKHLPTGLYVSFAAGESQPRGYNPPRATFAYVQGGIDNRYLSYGNTTLFAEYGNYTDFGVDAYAYSGTNLAGPVLFPATNGLIQNQNATVPAAQGTAISDTSVTRWGLGAVQKFDSAAMEIYAIYQHWDADVWFWTGAPGGAPTGTAQAPTDGFDGVALGGRVKF